MPLLGAAIAALAPLGGCQPNCTEMCDKLIDCELDSPRTSKAECVSSCESQQDLYATWEDQEKLDAFDEQQRCIGSSTCEELSDGVCYDDTVFVF